MSDRTEQVRAEAEQRYPGGQRRFTQANLQAAFRQGVEWADANPQPRTITLSQSEAILEAARALREQGNFCGDDVGCQCEDAEEATMDIARAALTAALGEDESDE